MLLTRLVEYYYRGSPEYRERPLGYQKKPVRWVLDLDSTGRPKGGFVPLGDPNSKDRLQKRGLEMLVPDIVRTSGIRPILLVDRADFSLAVGSEEEVPQRHQAFVQLVEECAEKTQERDVQAVLCFLKSLEGRPPPNTPPGMKPDDVVAFTVEDRQPWMLQSVQAFWAEQVERSFASEKGQCLACGQVRPLARRHTVKIKGIPGGQPSGLALVSANVPAFESHGLEESLVSPVCMECTEAYATALNNLLRDKATSLRLGEQVYVFWTREQADKDIFNLLESANPQDVRRLLQSAWRGWPRYPLQDDRYFATCLSASGGRVVVREWLEGSVAQAQEHLARYFRMQCLPGSQGERKFFPVSELARSLVPRQQRQRAEEAPKGLVANAVKALLRTALTGQPLPEWILYEAVRRNRAEQGPGIKDEEGRIVSWSRVALLKLAILSNHSPESIDEEGNMTTEDTRHPAYLCGRLLRLLERAQQAAVNPETTLIDRFYGAASSAPGSVFGVLFRTAIMAHLAKLRRERSDDYTRLQCDIAEVTSGLTTWPKALTLREQALFALGYFHQLHLDFTQTQASDSSTQRSS